MDHPPPFQIEDVDAGYARAVSAQLTAAVNADIRYFLFSGVEVTLAEAELFAALCVPVYWAKGL